MRIVHRAQKLAGTSEKRGVRHFQSALQHFTGGEPDILRVPASLLWTYGVAIWSPEIHLPGEHRQPPTQWKLRPDGQLVQGTLEMLILKTLTRGPEHGYGIAQSIQQVSEEVLRVEEGSLYPALHRLDLDGMIDSEWGQSANNRRAKYYRLTAHGRKRLAAETDNWARLAGAIARVMETA